MGSEGATLGEPREPVAMLWIALVLLGTGTCFGRVADLSHDERYLKPVGTLGKVPIPHAKEQSTQTRIGEELFFFDASPAYLQGLVALFAFVLGSLLLLDFVLGDTNLVKVFTGRERRSLVLEAMTSISVSEIVEKAVEVYEAVEKFENRDYTNLPRLDSYPTSI